MVHLRKVQFSFSSNCVESCEHKRIKNIFWILFLQSCASFHTTNHDERRLHAVVSMHHRVLLLQFSFKCHSQQFAHMTCEVKKHSFMTTSKRILKKKITIKFSNCVVESLYLVRNCSVLNEISNVIQYWRLSKLPTTQFLRKCFCGKLPKLGHNKNKEKHQCILKSIALENKTCQNNIMEVRFI